MVLTDDDINIIIKCMAKERNDLDQHFKQCKHSKYFEEFPHILEIKKQEVQRINKILIDLQCLKAG